jgi:hypothetical protein
LPAFRIATWRASSAPSGPRRCAGARSRSPQAWRKQRIRGPWKFDAVLKAEGLNPGTSADLTVASLFAQKLEELIAEGA